MLLQSPKLQSVTSPLPISITLKDFISFLSLKTLLLGSEHLLFIYLCITLYSRYSSKCFKNTNPINP